MGIGQDGPGLGDGGDRDEDRSTDDDRDLEAALSEAFGEEGEVLEPTTDDTHRAVGEDDPEAVFEAFDEDGPQDVIDAVETTTAVDGDDAADAVSGLFEDLSEVETDTVEAEPLTDEPAEREVEAVPAEPGETAEAVEGLLDDLTTVDVPGGADTAGAGTAHTQPTILDVEETEATGFQWLGEDIQVFADDGDPDAVFDTYAEETPEELIATADVGGVTAAGLFADLADGAVVERAETAAGNETSEPVDPAQTSVDATDLFADLGESVAAPVPEEVAEPGEDGAEPSEASAETPDPDLGGESRRAADSRGERDRPAADALGWLDDGDGGVVASEDGVVGAGVEDGADDADGGASEDDGTAEDDTTADAGDGGARTTTASGEADDPSDDRQRATPGDGSGDEAGGEPAVEADAGASSAETSETSGLFARILEAIRRLF